MAENLTGTSEITELVKNEVINDVILEYAHDFVVAAPFMYWKDLRGMGSKVGSFAQWVLDTADDTGETTDLTTTSLETTETQVTAAEVGIRRDPTYAAVEESMIGAQLFDFIVRDAGVLLAISLDDDICALFPSISTSVGSSGTDLSLANMVEAQATVRQQGMRGRLVYVLDDQQALDYQSAQAASTSTTINGLMEPEVSGGTENPYLGTFFLSEVWQTGLCDTANTGANVVGACFIRGDTNPTTAWGGAVMTRDVMTEFDKDIHARQHIVVTTAKWGVAEVAGNSAVKLVTDA